MDSHAPGTAAQQVRVAESAESIIGRYRWVVCALIFLATTINYVDRQILALIKEFLDKELGWTNEQFGMVNSAFQGAYAIGLFAFGRFVDRYGTKIGYAVSITLWSIAAFSHALVGSVGGFFGARVFLGVSEGGNFPAAIKSVALFFSKKERALATAIFNSGTNVGAIIAPAFVPLVALTLGWRWAFMFAGAAGFCWLLLWLPFYKPARALVALADGAGAPTGAAAERASEERPISLRGALGHREAWGFIVAKFMTDPVWWFFLTWLPDYFRASRGLDIKHSWIHLVSIYSIITVLSIFGGALSGALIARGWTVTRARKTSMFLFACCVIPILFVTRVGDWYAVLLIGLAGACHQAWSANLFTTTSDVFPQKDVATIVGLGGMAGAFGGILFPWFCGRMLDRFHQAGHVTDGYAILFGICASVYLVSFVVHHLLSPTLEPLANRPAERA